MRANSSFQSILEQKIKSQHPSANFSQTSNETHLDPAHLAFLMGMVDKSSFHPDFKKMYPTPPKPPPKPHSLSEAQQLAFDFLISHGAELAPAFTRKELRTAFRRTALRLHPDMNKGASGPFIQLKKHYEELSQLTALITESI